MPSSLATTLRVSCVAGALAAFASAAHADWSQRFAEKGVGPFDQIQITITSPTFSFADPAIGGFRGAPGWAQTFRDLAGTMAIAQGPSPRGADPTLYFDIGFTGARSSGFDFIFQAFNADTIVESSRVFWTGSGWSIAAVGSDDASKPVPSPGGAPVAAGFAGLIALRRER